MYKRNALKKVNTKRIRIKLSRQREGKKKKYVQCLQNRNRRRKSKKILFFLVYLTYKTVLIVLDKR